MLEVKELTIKGRDGNLLLNDFSLILEEGWALGLTGQSGAGKSTLLKAILGLLGSGQQILKGSVSLDGKDLALFSPKQRRDLCGKIIGFIPQSPMTSFDSRLTIGRQLEETIRLRLKLSPGEAHKLALNKLAAVNLPDVPRVFASIPDQLSGGMLQRVAVAMLLALKPRFILADEPTSALDEENRDILLELFKNQLAHAGLLLITHDAQAIRMLCRQTLILSAGRIIEHQSTDQLFRAPQQPWTREFIHCSINQREGEFRWKEL